MVHGTQVSVRTAFLACLLACFAILILPESEAELPVEDFTHAVIGEEFTATWCVYCPSAAENLYKVWQPKSEYPDDPYYHDQFFFVALITDVNDKADDRAGDYPDFTGYPTVYFDGGDEKVEGGQSDTSNYEQAIDNCGSRADTDISLRISMQHLGDDRIAVQAYITWNEDGGFGNPTFDGYIRAYIVEPISRYNNYDNEPYHFGFLDYAFDQEVELDSHEEVMLETVWVGGDHTDSNGDDFSDISYDNLNIFVSFFNNEQASADDYALQTAFAIPPDVNFWFPTEELSDTASLTGTASSPRTTIGSVEYKVDDGEWLLAEGTEEFDLQLDTTAYANGDHELLLRISNAFGTTRELTGTISIMNDGEAPEVEWLGPDSGSDVSGNVTLAALATDNDNIASVDYSINGGDWLPMEYIADNRWEAEWNTEVAGTENGEYTLVVRASDNYDNTATDSLTLTVANAGDVSYPEIILGEVPALPVADSFSVTVTANDPEGIYVIEYRLDGGGWIAVSGGSFNIDVPMLSDGVHDLEVQAIDYEGFKTVEPLISFECDAHKPEITLGEIPETATAMVRIDFTINDYSALSELHYRIAGGDEQPLNTGATSLEWDSTTVEDGVWIFEMEAVDALGNRETIYRNLDVVNTEHATLIQVVGARAGAPVEVRAYVDYPNLNGVDLLIASQRLEMQEGPAGFWSAEVTIAGAGQYPYYIEADTGHGSFQSEESMLNVGAAAPVQESSDDDLPQLPGPGIFVALTALGLAARRRR